MKLSLQTFWLVLWCWTNKVPIDQAMKVTGLSEVTIRRWYDKFRNHLPQDKLDEIRLEGIVQMDEAYKGKKNSKYSIIGAKQQTDTLKDNQVRKAAFQLIDHKSVDRKNAVDFLKDYIVPGSQLNTDGAMIYRAIHNWWPVNHEYERHNRFEFELTSEIEGVWGNFTTFIRRMYHHVTKDKIEAVLKEFQARFCFPKWFESPVDYLEISLKKLSPIKVKNTQNLVNFYYNFSYQPQPESLLRLAKKLTN